MIAVEIPNRSVFRAPEVCQIVGVQPYVLRSWEAEFPDLGVTRREGGPRVYRRGDVERVLRLKQLVFVEGLTLAGARRRLDVEGRPEEVDGPPIEELLGRDVRERLVKVREGLREVVRLLSDGQKDADSKHPLLVTGHLAPVTKRPARGGASSKKSARGRRI